MNWSEWRWWEELFRGLKLVDAAAILQLSYRKVKRRCDVISMRAGRE